jgi:hypothetical protein
MMLGVLKHALMITSFVLIMMLLIEYINVQTHGAWQLTLRKSRFGQYVLGAFLGVVPGCLGAFTVVSLYSHRAISFDALVAAMIATSGDEAFVMFSMFPLQALWISLTLFFVALVAGWLVDLLFKNQALFFTWRYSHPPQADDLCQGNPDRHVRQFSVSPRNRTARPGQLGIIPESGPHLVFVTLFAQGSIPFSILLASSIVQDGHGTFPLLAVSGRAFIWLKLVNIAFGLLLGLLGLYVLS